MANLEDLILRDTRANQPAAGIPGRLYYVTDENVTERDNGATWDDYSDEGTPGGGGIDSGTSFPGSPSTNDLFFRTDRGLIYYYDGTRWLTVTLYTQTIESQRVVTPLSSGNFFETAVWTEDYDQYIVDFRATVYVLTTNTGSAYWTLNLNSLDGGAAATLLVSVNTSAISANAWTRLKGTVNALLGTGKDGIEAEFTTTGSPGTLYVSSMVTYRLVG
jgi:hypothetical protein